MRLSARDLDPRVTTMPANARPIRLRAAGLVFAFEPAEALALAHQLADAVAEVNNERRTP